jgi:hypothetical protein
MVAEAPKKDIVIDTNVMRLYDKPADKTFVDLFAWLGEKGTLTVSQKLINEYEGTGNRLLAGLIDRLTKSSRYNRINNSALKAFNEDRHYNYTCNGQDRWHARLVFLSIRKRLVSIDNRLVNDVNDFRRVSGIKPRATRSPPKNFYE